MCQSLIAEYVVIVCVCVCQGVRDLLKAVLDKIQTIPTTVSSAIVQQLLAAREVQVASTFTILTELT